MLRWNAQDGLVQFLFANEDRYILNSMVCLNLTEYLNYELRKRNYAKIIFAEGLDGEYGVRVFNREVWNWCADLMRGPFGLGLKGKTEYHRDPKGCRIPCAADQIRKLTDEAEGTAFIFSLDTFSEIFRGRTEELENLIRTNAHAKNLFILRAGVTAEESQPILTDPDGIFMDHTKNGYLFPEVVSAFCEEDMADDGCYLRLYKLMRSSCVFLNQFTEEAVRRVVRYTEWVVRREKDRLSEEQMDQIAHFVWRWYHEAGLRTERPDLMSDNQTRKYLVLGKDLEKNWSAILENALTDDEEDSIQEWIPEPFVISDNMLVRQLPEMGFMGRISPDIQAELRAACARIRARLRKPRVCRPGKTASEYLKRFIDRLSIAIRKGDSETVRRIEICLKSIIRQNYRCDNENRLIWNCHETLISESARVFDAETDLDRNVRRRRDLYQELLKEAEQIKKKHYTSSSEKTHDRDHALKTRKAIENLDKKLDLDTVTISDMKEHILQLEQAEDMIQHQASGEDNRNVERLLREIAERFTAGAAQNTGSEQSTASAQSSGSGQNGETSYDSEMTAPADTQKTTEGGPAGTQETTEDAVQNMKKFIDLYI